MLDQLFQLHPKLSRSHLATAWADAGAASSLADVDLAGYLVLDDLGSAAAITQTPKHPLCGGRFGLDGYERLSVDRILQGGGDPQAALVRRAVDVPLISGVVLDG